MVIKNTFDLIFLTIMFIPFFMGIGIFLSAYLIYSNLKKGIDFSKEELLKDSHKMTGAQEFLAAIVVLLVITYALFIYGGFFTYLDAVKVYFTRSTSPETVKELSKTNLKKKVLLTSKNDIITL